MFTGQITFLTMHRKINCHPQELESMPTAETKSDSYWLKSASPVAMPIMTSVPYIGDVIRSSKKWWRDAARGAVPRTTAVPTLKKVNEGKFSQV